MGPPPTLRWSANHFLVINFAKTLLMATFLKIFQKIKTRFRPSIWHEMLKSSFWNVQKSQNLHRYKDFVDIIHIKKRFWASNLTYVNKTITYCDKMDPKLIQKIFKIKPKRCTVWLDLRIIFWTGVKRFHTVEKHITVNWCVTYGTFFDPIRVQTGSKKWAKSGDTFLTHLNLNTRSETLFWWTNSRIKINANKRIS